MKKIKHPTEILTEAEAIVISSSIIFALKRVSLIYFIVSEINIFIKFR